MSVESHQRVRRLFDEALERPEAERLRFVESQCGAGTDTYHAVVRLLAARRESESFLNETADQRHIGRYLVTGELGRGAMGIVYEAVDPLIGRTVAVKTILLQGVSSQAEADQMRERLFREARSAGALFHPGIVVVFDVGQEGDLAFIAMERVDGHSLLQRMMSGPRVELGVALDILQQTAAALDYAHRNGIIHRDIKPANIMLQKGVTVKIADFGIAKMAATEHHTRTGTLIGTPSYMSPEQIEGKTLDGRSDQFSLAVLSYELITGVRPFECDSLAPLVHMIVYGKRPSARSVNPSLPAGLDKILERGLSRLASERYDSCTEFIAAVADALRTAPPATRMPAALQTAQPVAPVRAPPPTNLAPGGPLPAARAPASPTKYYLIGIAGLLALILTMFAALNPSRSRKPSPPAPVETASATSAPVEVAPSSSIPVTPPPVHNEPIRTSPAPPTRPVDTPIPSVVEQPKPQPTLVPSPTIAIAPPTIVEKTPPIETKQYVPPAILQFSAQPKILAPGQSARLIWDTRGDIGRITLTPGPPIAPGNNALIVTPDRTTEYTLEASGPAGAASRVVIVEVRRPEPAPMPVTTPAPPPPTVSRVNSDAEAKRVFAEAQAQLSARKYDEASVLFGRAARLAPGWSEPWVERAKLEAKLGRFPDAIEDCNQAIRLNPNDVVALNLRGFARYSLNQVKESVADFDAAIRINPKSGDAYQNRGNAKWKLQDRQGAEADFSMARSLQGRR